MTIDEARQYVASAILPAMGIAGRRFTVEPPDDQGTRSSLHLIRAEGMPPLLLRSFRHRAQAARNAEALRHLDACGLPAPRLVFYDLWPVHVTVETWIEGIRHAAIPDPQAARTAGLAVARLLATYHAVTRPVWGRPAALTRVRLVSFAAATVRSARRMVRDLRAGGWLGDADAALLTDHLGAWQETIAAIATYNLVHKDANRHNFVVDAAGKVTPVDLHRLSYEPFPEEVVNALFHFCRKDRDLARDFEETYFATAGDQARALFDRTRGFFEPLNFLKKMHRRAIHAEGGGAGPDDPQLSRWKPRVLELTPPS